MNDYFTRCYPGYYYTNLPVKLVNIGQGVGKMEEKGQYAPQPYSRGPFPYCNCKILDFNFLLCYAYKSYEADYGYIRLIASVTGVPL